MPETWLGSFIWFCSESGGQSRGANKKQGKVKFRGSSQPSSPAQFPQNPSQELLCPQDRLGSGQAFPFPALTAPSAPSWQILRWFPGGIHSSSKLRSSKPQEQLKQLLGCFSRNWQLPSQILTVDFQFPTFPVSWIPPLNFLLRNFSAPTSHWPPVGAQTMATLLWEHEILEFPKRIFLSSPTSPPIIFSGILPPHLHNNSISSWGISTPSWNGNGSCCLFLTCWYLKIPVQVVLACPLLCAHLPPIFPYSSWEQNLLHRQFQSNILMVYQTVIPFTVRESTAKGCFHWNVYRSGVACKCQFKYSHAGRWFDFCVKQKWK